MSANSYDQNLPLAEHAKPLRGSKAEVFTRNKGIARDAGGDLNLMSGLMLLFAYILFS
jgi:hypothetical protein